MKHCVFCNGTGVHQCPGGTLESGYWARRERLEGTASTSFTLGGEPASDYSPGLVNADDYYALPEFDPPREGFYGKWSEPLPAWDQPDGVWCEEHKEDATLCPCSDQPPGDV